MLSGSGATRLFQFKGITVFIHWSWLLVAVFEISGRTGTYSSFIWNVLEYLAIFVIVTMHEFGHAFACRSVGGRADEILLWPLGGVAIVDPPARPGATLWSIAAGPLVNVALAPILGALTVLIPWAVAPDIHAFLRSLTVINVGMLFFNLLPIFPLDGGQILGALLWFVIGRARSMLATAVIGLAGVAAIFWLALVGSSPWLGLIGFFVARQCLASMRRARALIGMGSAPRRPGVACPSCHRSPPIGRHWRCDWCGASIDLFDASAGAAIEPGTVTTLSLSDGMGTSSAEAGSAGQCPACHVVAETARCGHCDGVTPLTAWNPAASGWLSATMAGVTRLRPPVVPSIAPLVLGVCAAIVVLTLNGLAVVAYRSSSAATDAGVSTFLWYVSIALGMCSLVPAIAATVLVVRYRRTLEAFTLAVGRFHSERDHA